MGFVVVWDRRWDIVQNNWNCNPNSIRIPLLRMFSAGAVQVFDAALSVLCVFVDTVGDGAGVGTIVASAMLGTLAMLATKLLTKVIFERFHTRPGNVLGMLFQVLILLLMFGMALDWTFAMQRCWFLGAFACVVQDIFVVEPSSMLYAFCYQRKLKKKKKRDSSPGLFGLLRSHETK